MLIIYKSFQLPAIWRVFFILFFIFLPAPLLILNLYNCDRCGLFCVYRDVTLKK
ncbi:hypothetical protein HMPREF0201_03047 [Cedecea davisae DSM 4568]|uniref:Uncharacterized protein n=1 Tax=Cedecea davisae DSM 4568 TaxID=566551 RepID=S3J735_9ENTR|nr:hypothetical protein HMPREF0201_03047 [Cedecea davisae DSM 4568]